MSAVISSSGWYNQQIMGDKPIEVDGITCHAPDLINHSEDYPYAVFSRIDFLESKHYWYRGRKQSILNLLVRSRSLIEGNHFLEIGGGTGATSSFLKKEIPGKYLVSEISIEALKNARTRYPENSYVQMDARRIPYQYSFDAVGMFDVLEHINEEETVLSQIYKALKTGGILVLSVPQYQWLWSEHDELSGHKRRYTRGGLRETLMRNRFELIDQSSYLFLAFPLMLIARLIKPKSKLESGSHFSEVSGMEVSSVINWLLTIATMMDSLLIRMGFRLPWGGSLLVVARKV